MLGKNAVIRSVKRRVQWAMSYQRFLTHQQKPHKAGLISVRNSLLEPQGGASNSTNTNISTSEPLTWYSCGPTVYDASHLGHARTYVCTDIIRRILVDYFNVRVNYAMGITDIDDKIIAKGKSKSLHTWLEMQAMVRGLEDDFFKDMDRLNVLRPDAVLRVTEHIPDIIAYITRLVELGSAYVTEDGVYFDFSSQKNAYDKFGVAHVERDGDDNSDITTPTTPSVDTVTHSASSAPSAYVDSTTKHSKRHYRDFALWKLHHHTADASNQTTNSVQECVWDSPWGPGRPGWHIECSAMTHALFGDHIDIHSGGVDLKFPHHTNEIAQW